MLDIKWIRENPTAFDRALARRGAEPEARAILCLDEEQRALLQQIQAEQMRRNAISRVIGVAKSKGEPVEQMMAEVAQIKATLPILEAKEKGLSEEIQRRLARLPNVPLDEVPDGKDEHDNVEKSMSGQKRLYDFEPVEHFEIGVAAKLMDFETAAKLSGSRFVVLKGGLARLERALGQFMLDLHTTEHDYTEVQPPLLVRNDAMFGTGQLPKFGKDLFIGASMESREAQARHIIADYWTPKHTEKLCGSGGNPADIVCEVFEAAPTAEDFWLIPTAEVPLTNLVRESILDEKELPLRFTALTPCFRSEAGSAGRDTRGMLRQHQFNKVELVSITTPETSLAEHERMLTCAEAVLRALDLHYRVVTLCTGDMGFGAQKTYDIEVWLPGQKAYREISSVSVCGDFQARRMNARYRPAGDAKGTRFVHTLNGSGTAVGRCLIAVMETFQNEDGSVTVPPALRPYMGGLEKLG